MVSSSGQEDLDLSRLENLVRRMVERRLDDSDTIDDIVQETLTRVLEVRGRLEQRSLASYAAIIARNLIISLERGREVERRQAPRLFHPKDPESPEDFVLRDEDRKAVLTALAQLSARDRSLAVGHDAHGISAIALGRKYGLSPGAVATRLTRLRAELRLNYVMALRRTKLPTALCRPVLLALSARDIRRQRVLDAARHLLECSTCASLSEPLLARRRILAPVLAPSGTVERVASWMRAHPAQAVAAGGTATVVVATLWPTGPPPRPPRRDAVALTLGGEPAFAGQGGQNSHPTRANQPGRPACTFSRCRRTRGSGSDRAPMIACGCGCAAAASPRSRSRPANRFISSAKSLETRREWSREWRSHPRKVRLSSVGCVST
jgi:RNA polymerase sigma factor (sigma-70 family)